MDTTEWMREPTMRIVSLMSSMKLRCALVCVPLLAIAARLAAGAPEGPSVPEAGRSAAIIVDPAWLKSPAVKKEIEAYRASVAKEFGYELLVMPMQTTCKPVCKNA